MNPDSARNPGKNCPVVVSKILACEKQMFLLAHCRWVTFREEERLLPSDRNSTLMTQNLSRIRSEALIGRRSSFIIFAIVYEWQTKDKRPQRRNERRWISDKIVNIWVFWSSFADEHNTLPKSTRRNVKFNKFAFETPWLPDLSCKHWFTSSVWNFCRWVADVPPRKTSLSGDEREETSAVRRLGFGSHDLILVQSLQGSR